MSREYDEYIRNHKKNVAAAYQWICDNLPYLIGPIIDISRHDDSKYNSDEYHAYDAYFYGGNRSYSVVKEFNRAWLTHIHRNPHHWQHWILFEDDPESTEPFICMEMPAEYLIEMICDWWAFSFASGNLYEIFDWYKDHKDKMYLHKDTRFNVEMILDLIKAKLDELEKEGK